MPASQFPLLVYGQITESGTGVNAITVKLRNNSTNDVGSTTTNSTGLYIFDLSDSSVFANGYTNSQSITVYTIYKNFEGQVTFTIAIPLYGYQKDIALTAVTDSTLIDYCKVQDVYDELDAKTATDISTARIVKAIQRAEGLIDLKTNTSFKQITVTDEVHTVDRYSIDISPDYLDTISFPTNSRRDGLIGVVTNRVKTNYAPIVSVTSLSRNAAAFDATDSWTALTQQSGSGGDFVIEDATAGIIDFIDQYPRIGKRSWKLTYVYGYNRDSTDRRVISLLKVVERLAVILACKAIITTKSTGSMFDSMRDVRIGAIEIKAGAMSGGQYIKSVEPEIIELWREIGELGVEVI